MCSKFLIEPLVLPSKINVDSGKNYFLRILIESKKLSSCGVKNSQWIVTKLPKEKNTTGIIEMLIKSIMSQEEQEIGLVAYNCSIKMSYQQLSNFPTM